MEDLLLNIFLYCDNTTLLAINQTAKNIFTSYFWQLKFHEENVPNYVKYDLRAYLKYDNISIEVEHFNDNPCNWIRLNIKNKIVVDFINENYQITASVTQVLMTTKRLVLKIGDNLNCFEISTYKNDIKNWDNFLTHVLYNKEQMTLKY